MPPMEADAAYQAAQAYHQTVPSCKLQSRSLAVRHTSKARRCVDAILRWHTRVMQSPDCADVLYNLQIVHMCYAISRLSAQSRDSENAQCNFKIAQHAEHMYNHSYKLTYRFSL